MELTVSRVKSTLLVLAAPALALGCGLRAGLAAGALSPALGALVGTGVALFALAQAHEAAGALRAALQAVRSGDASELGAGLVAAASRLGVVAAVMVAVALVTGH